MIFNIYQFARSLLNCWVTKNNNKCYSWVLWIRNPLLCFKYEM